MRRALSASAAAHGLLLAGAFLLVRPTARPEDLIALQSVAVSIVSTETASDSTSQRQSDATATTVAAGSVSPDNPDLIEPVKPLAMPVESARPVDPIETAALPAVIPPVAAEPAELAEPVPASAIAPAPPIIPISAAAPAALATPAALAELAASPADVVPQAALIEAVAMMPPERSPAARPRVRPRPEPQVPPAPKPSHPRSRAQNGLRGQSPAGAEAAPASRGGAGRLAQGGAAADTRYPGLVLGALRRALHRPPGGGVGEVQVGFTVLGNGGVTGVRVVASSGSALLDAAATDTVRRAAPFPPIPPDAGRSSWPFVMPLEFRR